MKILFILLAIFLYAVEAQAVNITRYVAKTGSDSNTCTQAQSISTPKLTINAGLSCTGSGDILLIRGGTYIELLANSVNKNYSSGLSAAQPTIISAYPRDCARTSQYGPGPACEQVIIKLPGPGIYPDASTLNIYGPLSYMTWDALIFDGSTLRQPVGPPGGPGYGPNTIATADENNTRPLIGFKFLNNQVQGGYCQGILMGKEAVEFRHNKFIGPLNLPPINPPYNICPPQGAHGIYTSGHNHVIDNNEFIDWSGYGIHLYTQDIANADNNTISNNRFHNNSTSILPGAGHNNRVFGNIITGSGNGIVIGFSAISAKVYNNTLWNNTTCIDVQGSSWDEGGSGPTTIKNNICYQNKNGDFINTSAYGGGSLTKTDNLEGPNPLFINTGTGNFNLGSGSPAINTGTTAIASLPAPGITIQACPATGPFFNCYNGSQPDLGAFESGAPGPVNQPPTVTVTSPNPFNAGNASTVKITGTASDPEGALASVTYLCERCGTGSGSAGPTNVTGPLTGWSIDAPIHAGINRFTVTATDTGGLNSASITVTVNQVPTFPGNTLAGAWAFGEGSGTSTVDSSGNSNTATFIGAPVPSWVIGQGKFGNAIRFNSSAGQYLSVADHASLDFTQSFSLSIYARPTAVMNDSVTLIFKGPVSSAAPLPVYRLYASTASGCPTVGGSAALFNANGALNNQFFVCGPPLSPGNWNHLATTYDNATQQFRLYVNGVEAVAPGGTSPLAAVGYIESSSADLTIGGSSIFNVSPFRNFDGDLNVPRVYNVAIPLSAGTNLTPGNPCGDIDYTTTVKNAFSAGKMLASVRGDMNCPVVSLTPPSQLKISGTFKIGSGVKLSTTP